MADFLLLHRSVPPIIRQVQMYAVITGSGDVVRHTAITRLVHAGANIPTIMKISGHETVAMVLRYTHADANHISIAATALGMTIPGAVHPEPIASKNAAVVKSA